MYPTSVFGLESCVIQRVSRETHDTFTVELQPQRANGGFHFAPGQFNMVYVFGVGEVPISISGHPESSKSIVHTVRRVGNVTSTMGKFRKGDVLGVRGPYGRPWPVKEAQGNDVVIVAGGIGLAPLRPAVYSILSHREKYGKVVLLYGSRRPEDILFRSELERWRARFDLDVHVSVDRADPSWKGNVGVVTTLISKAPFDPPSTVAMICGPEIMMRYVAEELQDRGVAHENIFLSLERNMKCGIGLCGHCQFQQLFICKDGPVFNYSRIKHILTKREV
jgi:NAD(P)H-flavin reductase